MATKQTKRMRRLRKDADKLWFKACMKHWGGYCMCGKPAVQVHHFYPKGQFGHLRYDIENGVPICMGCHMRVTNPNFVLDVIKQRGKEWHDSLFEKAKLKPASFRNVGWYQDIIEELETK